MQPKILTMPDSLRDALTGEFRTIMPTISGDIDKQDYDRIGAALSKHLFSETQDAETKTFKHAFANAYAAMHDGTGSPALMLRNLPPYYGRLVMYGLASIEGSIQFANKKSAKNASEPHRDTYVESTRDGHKLGQYLYCQNAGNDPQPTVFITADEVIDHMAGKRTDMPVAQARAQIIEQLSAIEITSPPDVTRPFLTRNPFHALHPDAKPEFIAFTADRSVKDENKIRRGTDTPQQHRQKRDLYSEFDEAARAVVDKQARHAVGSRQDNTLLVWNDLLVFHARGKNRDGKDRSSRRIEVLESKFGAAPDAPNVAVASPYSMGQPSSKINAGNTAKSSRIEDSGQQHTP